MTLLKVHINKNIFPREHIKLIGETALTGLLLEKLFARVKEWLKQMMKQNNVEIFRVRFIYHLFNETDFIKVGSYKTVSYTCL